MVSEAQKLEVIQMILALQDEQLLARVKAVITSSTNEKNSRTASIPGQSSSVVRPFGFAKGLITYVSPDFDETPAGFEEYMPKVL